MGSASNDSYYQAVLARDYRFDGKFFVGVKTTGIYCRPICPARPKRENMEFFPDALAAEKAGYRPCLRCRPECAPFSPAWSGRNAVVNRALRLIASPTSHEGGEEELAGQVGMSARHLRRLFQEELGKTPNQIADDHRLNFARKLVLETGLSMIEIASTAGFASLRRLNDAFKRRFHRAPSGIRRLRDRDGVREGAESGAWVDLSLPYRPPLDWQASLDFCRVHPVHGSETLLADRYERVFRFNGKSGVLRLSPAQNGKPELRLQVLCEGPGLLYLVVQNVRRMFDLDSDPLLIANQFAAHPFLKQLELKYPGLRVTRGWDPFESSVATILGQLVSTEQASRLVRSLVETFGERLNVPGYSGGEAILFPSPRTLAGAALSDLGTTSARKAAIREFSKRVDRGEIRLDSFQDPARFRDKVSAIPGVGPWTREYMSLRAMERIRPWLGYLAVYLWKEFSKPGVST